MSIQKHMKKLGRWGPAAQVQSRKGLLHFYIFSKSRFGYWNNFQK